MKENEYITITRESYNMMNDLLIERANHIVNLRKKVESLQKQLNEFNNMLKDMFVSEAYFKYKRAQYFEKESK